MSRHIGRREKKVLCSTPLKRAIESEVMHRAHTINTKEKRCYYSQICDNGIFLPLISPSQKLTAKNFFHGPGMFKSDHRIELMA